jgi:outer membrane protein assembly factor BamB
MMRLLIFSLTLSVSLTWAADWAEFRGPTAQGHYAGPLPTKWGPTTNVAWHTPIAGKAWSSPVVAAGTVYLTTAVPDMGEKPNYSLRALALDAGSGKVKWDVEIFRQEGSKAPKIHAKNSHASPTPIVADGKLYVHFGHMGTACLDLTGKVLWQTTIKYSPVHGNGGTPVLTHGKLILSCDGGDQQFVIALDAATGKEAWRTDRKSMGARKFAFCTPLVIDVAGQPQVILPGANLVGAYDPTTGKELWRVRYNGYSVIPRPVFGHGLVFVSTSYDSPNLLAIRPDGTGDVTDTHVAWTLKRAVAHTPSLVLVGNELYMVSDNGIASCRDAKTGKEYWNERLGGGFSASILYADGKLYFQNEDGAGWVVKAGTKYELIAKNDLKEPTLASFAAADGALFIRTGTQLYRIQEPK